MTMQGRLMEGLTSFPALTRFQHKHPRAQPEDPRPVMEVVGNASGPGWGLWLPLGYWEEGAAAKERPKATLAQLCLLLPGLVDSTF